MLDSVVEFESIFVSGCRAANGAGLGASTSSVTISNSAFSQNGITSSSATLLQGAGAYIEDGLLNMISCVFESHSIGISSGNINGGVLAVFRSNATLSGSSSVSGVVITKTEGGTVQGGIEPHFSQLFNRLFSGSFYFFACPIVSIIGGHLFVDNVVSISGAKKAAVTARAGVISLLLLSLNNVACDFRLRVILQWLRNRFCNWRC